MAGAGRPPSHFKPCPGDSEEVNFVAYDLGPAFDGLRLSSRLRRCTAPLRWPIPSLPFEPTRANMVAFIYGDCDAGAHGCLPSVEVQTWPACDRSLSDYLHGRTGAPVPHRRLHLRGVPVAAFDEGVTGSRLELYTSDVTVVIFGRSLEQTMRAAANLRRIDEPDQRSMSQALPDPVSGHLGGTLSCGLRGVSVTVTPRRRRARGEVPLLVRTPRQIVLTGALRYTEGTSRSSVQRFRPVGIVQFGAPRGRSLFRLRHTALGQRLQGGAYLLVLKASDADGRRMRLPAIRFILDS